MLHTRSALGRAALLAATAVLVPALAAGPALAGPGSGHGRGSGHGNGHAYGHGKARGIEVHGCAVRNGGKRVADLAAAQAAAAKAVTRLGTCLDRAVSDTALTGLDADAVAALRASAVADHATLDDLGAQAAAATDAAGLSSVVTALKAFRVDSYKVAVRALRATTRMSADIAELTTTLADDADAQAALAQAQTAVDAARAGALTLHATSTKDDVAAVRAALRTAHDLLEPYEDSLAG